MGNKFKIRKKNKEFNITFPYRKNNISEDFVWTWNSSEWEFNISLNNQELSDSQFEEQPNPETGKFKLAQPINPQEDFVSAEFINIAGNQRSVKIGSKISVKAKSAPSGISPPELANFKINFTTVNSVENVDGHFSSTAQGEDFYLQTPAHGYASLSGHGWSFTPEEGTAGSGGTGNTRITGDLTGPILFFDAFASDNSRIISKTPGIATAFPTVDIVFGNATNTFGIPFVEIFSILFTPPPPPDVDRITSTRSLITDRLTIAFNDDNALQQKYSFTNFSDFDTEDGWDFMLRSMRRTIPIYSELVNLIQKDFTVESDGSILFNVTDTADVPVENTEADPTSGGDRVLVAIGVEFDREDEVGINESAVYELQSSTDGTNFEPYGYTNGQGETSAQVVIVPDENVYIQIPDSNGITQIKLVPIDIQGQIPTPLKVIGAYVDSLITGRTPALFETSFGEYVLFFTQNVDVTSQRQISALLSRQDAQTWQRPAIEAIVELSEEEQQALEDSGLDTESVEKTNELFERPIILLTGYSNPVLLKSNITDNFFIFVFNHRVIPGTIDMVEMNRALFLKIEEDNTSEASDIDAETPDESQTSLVNTPEVTSYARVFKANDTGGFNHVKPVLTNASQNFTAELTPNGDLYIALIDSSGQFRIKYNRALGSGSIDTSFNWEDLGIDLLDTQTDNGDGTAGSKLSKVVDQTNIGALSLKYSPVEDVLFLFISTLDDASFNPGKLFMVRIPESIIRPAGLKTNPNDGQTHFFLGQDLTDEEVDQFFQVVFNRIKPVLVAGTKEGLSDEFVETRSSTADDFPSQIVSVEWLVNGTGQVYFVSDGQVRARKTNSSGIFWENFSNV